MNRILLLLTTLFVALVSAQGQTGSNALSKRLEQRIQSAVQKERFSGSVTVTHDGKPLISKGYGMANYELDVPNTPHTKFRLASMTKQFTAMAIMILRERHKLSLSDKICAYLDRCPDTWGPITIQQSLTHTSGIPEFEAFVTYEQAPSILTRSAFVDTFRNAPLDFAPGTSWKYSDSAYYLLGLVIERVSGVSYDEFLHREIFAKLGMIDTGSDDAVQLIKDRASGYKWKGDRMVNTHHPNIGIIPFSAGVLYSTVEDMARWSEALSTEKLLPRAALDEMFSPVVKIGSEPFASLGLSSGYGWFVGKRFGHRTVEHDGQIIGFSSMIIRFPDDHYTVIVLSNNQTFDCPKFAADLAAILFN